MLMTHTRTSDQISLVYSTIDNLDQARAISRTLLDEGLIACANIIPGMISLYHWQGKLEEAAEFVLLLKTRAPLVDQVIARTRRLHPYDTPAIFALSASDCDPEYADWIRGATSPAGR